MTNEFSDIKSNMKIGDARIESKDLKTFTEAKDTDILYVKADVKENKILSIQNASDQKAMNGKIKSNTLEVQRL